MIFISIYMYRLIILFYIEIKLKQSLHTKLKRVEAH